MSGVNVVRERRVLMLILSLSILATLTVIGVTLVAAMLVIPAVVARMITDSFGRMLGALHRYRRRLRTGRHVPQLLRSRTLRHHDRPDRGLGLCCRLGTWRHSRLSRTKGMDSHVEDALVEPTASPRAFEELSVTNRLATGDAAPAFSLPDADGGVVSLADYAGAAWSSTSTRPP